MKADLRAHQTRKVEISWILKFRYCEKATKFEKMSLLFLKLLGNIKTTLGDFFYFLLPSQKFQIYFENVSYVIFIFV